MAILAVHIAPPGTNGGMPRKVELGWLLIVDGGVSKIDAHMHTEFNVGGV